MSRFSRSSLFLKLILIVAISLLVAVSASGQNAAARPEGRLLRSAISPAKVSGMMLTVNGSAAVRLTTRMETSSPGLIPAAK